MSNFSVKSLKECLPSYAKSNKNWIMCLLLNIVTMCALVLTWFGSGERIISSIHRAFPKISAEASTICLFSFVFAACFVLLCCHFYNQDKISQKQNRILKLLKSPQSHSESELTTRQAR